MMTGRECCISVNLFISSHLELGFGMVPTTTVLGNLGDDVDRVSNRNDQRCCGRPTLADEMHGLSGHVPSTVIVPGLGFECWCK